MDDWSNGGESAKGQVDISSMKKALWGPRVRGRTSRTPWVRIFKKSAFGQDAWWGVIEYMGT